MPAAKSYPNNMKKKKAYIASTAKYLSNRKH